MKLGMEIGLRPGHIVLGGDPAPSPKGAQSPNFRPMSVVAKVDQDATWYEGRPRPMPQCVLTYPTSIWRPRWG